MSEIKLKLQYGDKIIKNLNTSWIQEQTMSPGYMLCYDDDIFNRGIIYRSPNKKKLLIVQDKLMDGINKGQKVLRL